MQTTRQEKRYKKRFWIRTIYAERNQKGELNLLIRQMMLYDKD